MIQHVTVDYLTHELVSMAAREAGMTYDNMLTWIVSDWATTWRNKQRQHDEHPHDKAGIIPGGI
jgi:hypothetical protein